MTHEPDVRFKEKRAFFTRVPLDTALKYATACPPRASEMRGKTKTENQSKTVSIANLRERATVICLEKQKCLDDHPRGSRPVSCCQPP
jgi:hypothetical protein